MNPQVARSRAAALAAAREILFSQGWDAVTHASVSKVSSVGRTTLYRHWPTIELLLRDVLLSESVVRHPAASGATRDDLTAELDALGAQLSTPTLERAMSTIMDRATVSPEFAKVREGCTRRARPRSSRFCERLVTVASFSRTPTWNKPSPNWPAP
jgi:AcrR family transcriptional regulator